MIFLGCFYESNQVPYSEKLDFTPHGFSEYASLASSERKVEWFQWTPCSCHGPECVSEFLI